MKKGYQVHFSGTGDCGSRGSNWGLRSWSKTDRSTPFVAISHIISQVREGKMRLDSFVLTVFFLMIHYIAIFACLYMIFGVVVDNTGQPITGLWNHFYFSTVTFTTLGFGNLVPANFGGELIAAIEALVGFAAFAFLIGIAAAVVIGQRKADDI